MSDDLSGDMLAPSWPNLVSNVSGQTDRLLVTVTSPRVTLSVSDRRVGGNFERWLKNLCRYKRFLFFVPRYVLRMSKL